LFAMSEDPLDLWSVLRGALTTFIGRLAVLCVLGMGSFAIGGSVASIDALRVRRGVGFEATFLSLFLAVVSAVVYLRFAGKLKPAIPLFAFALTVMWFALVDALVSERIGGKDMRNRRQHRGWN
jgi:hypothetical protein